MHPNNKIPSNAFLLVSITLLPLSGLAACSEEAPPPPPPPQSSSQNFQDDFQPPPPIQPTRAALQLASGVSFPDDRRPSEDALAQSIASLANALATGDVQAMSDVLTDESQAVLNQLVETGLWLASTDNIQQVRVVTIDDASQTTRVGLGIQESSGAYLLAWEGTAAGDRWRFTGLAIEPRTADDVMALDGAMLALRALPSATPLETLIDPAANDPRREEQDDRPSQNRSRGGGKPTR